MTNEVHRSGQTTEINFWHEADSPAGWRALGLVAGDLAPPIPLRVPFGLMPNLIDIPEGRTNDFLIPGVFVLIAGGILFLVHWSIAVLLFALAIAFFSLGSGIEIAVSRREARVYKQLWRLRFGAWVPLDQYSHIDLRYTNESQVMSIKGVENNVRVRTYDLHFTGPDGASRLLHEFSDYRIARRCAEAMVSSWSMTLADEVQERRQRSQDATHPNRR